MASLRRVREQFVPQELLVTGVRLHLFGGVIALLFVLLLARLWYLQILFGEHFRQAASANRSRVVRTIAPRGSVEDNRGRPLVTNRAQFTVFIDPADLPKASAKREAVFVRLAEILRMPLQDLEEVMRRKRGSRNDPIPVSVVKIDLLSQIAENRLRLPGVTVQA